MKTIIFSEPLCKGASAFDRIADLQEQIRVCPDRSIMLLIKTKGRIGLTFVFMIGCLPLYAERLGKTLRIRVSQKMYRLLSSINVIDYYKKSRNSDYQISFDDLLKQPAFKMISSPNDIIPFVNNIAMEVPVNLSEETSAILTSRIGEIYLNALEHSRATIVLGGKYFKFQKNKYCFSCYDNGVGIPEKINTYFISRRLPAVSSNDAVKWALQKGNSTTGNRRIPRGVGLDLLRSFAIQNGGVIRICSGNTLYILNNRGEDQFTSLAHTFHGTLFEMDIFSDRIHSN